MTRPLEGRRVVVTRAVHQAAGLMRAFAAAGARPVNLPLLEVTGFPDDSTEERRLAATALRLDDFDWLIYTSANAVRAFPPTGTSLPSGLRLAAVGNATGAALEDRGFEFYLQPRDKRAEGLVEALRNEVGAGSRCLLPQAEDARTVLAEGLRAAGASVTAVTAYRKALPPRAAEDARRLFGDADAAEGLGWVTFTSPRIARHFASLFGTAWPQRRRGLKAASIGPVTSAALEELGVSVDAEALRPDPDALVSAAEAAARSC